MRHRLATIVVVQLFLILFGLLATGFSAQDGDDLTTSLWAKAVLEVAGNPVTLIWKRVGADITPSGDQVISGYFYADPIDFAYGSIFNPELFVKIYIAANGWCNIAFNHVTVDPVTIHSAHGDAGTAQQTGTATLTNRLVEHQYNGVAIDTTIQNAVGATGTADAAGYTLTSALWARAILQPVSGAVNLIWKVVGTDRTPSGDTVVSGYFYASPNDFAYGSVYNPEVFVKVYIASNGWANIAFNHVTVDSVAIASAYQYAGVADQTATATLNGRLVEHPYTVAVTPPVEGTVVDAAGGSVTPGQGSDLSSAATLVVPSGALSGSVSIGMAIREASTTALEDAADATTANAIMAYAMERSNADYLHPIYTPAAIFAGGTNVGLEFALTPDGVQFAQPARLDVPRDDIALQSDDFVIGLLEAADGSMSVVYDATITANALQLPIDHFSDVSIWRIIKNTFAFAYTSLASFPEAEIQKAKQTVGPFVSTVNAAVVGNFCKSKKKPYLNTAVLPSYYDLLNNLARSAGDIGGETLAYQNPLKDYITNAHRQGLPPLSMSDICSKALEYTDGDAFTALVLAHEVLRADRFDQKLKNMVADVRGDSSEDEVGARYHLIGTAIYGFWYEHIQRQPEPSKLIVPPNLASLLEEAFVSGDIYSDPGEYVVDIAGAELGRQLYQATLAGCPEGAFDFSIAIPGYSGPFDKQLIVFGLGLGSDGIEYPSVTAASSTEAYSPDKDDLMTLVFSRTLAPGTYTIDDTWVSEGGPVEVFFTSHEIMEDMSPGFQWPVGFGQTGGSLTVESFGTAEGDRLKGSFSMTVAGTKDTCVDAACQQVSTQTITGTISGTFDGVIQKSTGK